ncbi:MAG: hypothetical protein JWM21_911 [Acidobacteria bacterium]|nr:hypothetical protein [Acidobacteriota bacterium]
MTSKGNLFHALMGLISPIQLSVAFDSDERIRITDKRIINALVESRVPFHLDERPCLVRFNIFYSEPLIFRRPIGTGAGH